MVLDHGSEPEGRHVSHAMKVIGPLARRPSQYLLIPSITHPPKFFSVLLYALLMVYVNSKKYACESCIKGHRSSNCHHNDRPLFEIKKKGRPVSQCEKCREARQSRRIHAKCTCDSERTESARAIVADGEKKKGKRFIPSVPTLPNGLKDALKASSSSSTETANPRQPVDALLNPCHCKDVYNCKCRPRADSHVSLTSRPSKQVDPTFFSDGLSALALVAACCSPAVPSVLVSGPSLHKFSAQTVLPENAAASRHTVPPVASHMHGNSESRPAGTAKRKRSPPSSPIPRRKSSDVNHVGAKSLRPIAPASLRADGHVLHDSSSSYPRLLPITSSGSSLTASRADTPNASDSEGSQCCCGTRCECAGCGLHGLSTIVDVQPSWVDDPAEAGPSRLSEYRHGRDCSADCPTCVDYEGGVELPSMSSIPGVADSTRASAPPFLEAFLARAAALPAPPLHSRSSLDPTNVTVYPAGLFKRPEGRGGGESARVPVDERPRAFGLVRIPKLEECCGGRCGCAEDACGCGDKCDGCCMENEYRSADDHGNKAGSRINEREGARLSPSISFARRSDSQNSIPAPVVSESAGAAVGPNPECNAEH